MCGGGGGGGAGNTAQGAWLNSGIYFRRILEKKGYFCQALARFLLDENVSVCAQAGVSPPAVTILIISSDFSLNFKWCNRVHFEGLDLFMCFTSISRPITSITSHEVS